LAFTNDAALDVKSEAGVAAILARLRSARHMANIEAFDVGLVFGVT
jgi:hypothetical protein